MSYTQYWERIISWERNIYRLYRICLFLLPKFTVLFTSIFIIWPTFGRQAWWLQMMTCTFSTSEISSRDTTILNYQTPNLLSPALSVLAPSREGYWHSENLHLESVSVDGHTLSNAFNQNISSDFSDWLDRSLCRYDMLEGSGSRENIYNIFCLWGVAYRAVVGQLQVFTLRRFLLIYDKPLLCEPWAC